MTVDGWAEVSGAAEVVSGAADVVSGAADVGVLGTLVAGIAEETSAVEVDERRMDGEAGGREEDRVESDERASEQGRRDRGEAEAAGCQLQAI